GALGHDADVFEVIERCWRGAWEEAFVRASRMLATDRPDLWAERALTAVRFECGRRLGRSVPDLDASIVEDFEDHPFTRAWAARLRAVSGGGSAPAAPLRDPP